MLVQKPDIFSKLDSLRDSLIERVKYIYDRQKHPSKIHSTSSSSSDKSSKSESSKKPEEHTIKGIKEKVEDNLEFKDNYASKITEYFNSFCDFLNTYLNRNGSTELAEAIKEVLVWAYGYEYRRRLVYEKPMDFGIPNNQNYNNLENLFFNFQKLINLTANEFIQESEFKYTVSDSEDSDESETSPLEFSKNTFLENFKNEITSLREKELPAINDLAEWLKHNSGGNFYLMNKFEDLGRVLHFPDKKEMIQCMYYDTNLLKIIKYFNFSTYVPSSLKNVKLEELM